MSIKKLHREIMLSAVYQLERRRRRRRTSTKDSGNRWYWRANRRRMTAEQMRDSVLFVSGALDDEDGRPVDAADAVVRRGARSTARSAATSSMSSCSCSTSRARHQSPRSGSRTNVPLQRLFFMNSDFMQQQAERSRDAWRPKPDNAARDPEGVSPDLRPRADDAES